MPLEVGSRLGHYDVTALIGEGGMGQVYQATDTKLKRQVALKILPEAFSILVACQVSARSSLGVQRGVCRDPAGLEMSTAPHPARVHARGLSCRHGS